MGRRVLRRHIWGYYVCLCPIKRTPGVYELKGYVFFFLNSVLRPFQDYFSSYETGQSVGGAKTGEPREKTPGTPASRTWPWLVSYVARAGLEPTPDTAVRRSID